MIDSWNVRLLQHNCFRRLFYLESTQNGSKQTNQKVNQQQSIDIRHNNGCYFSVLSHFVFDIQSSNLWIYPEKFLQSSRVLLIHEYFIMNNEKLRRRVWLIFFIKKNCLTLHFTRKWPLDLQWELSFIDGKRIAVFKACSGELCEFFLFQNKFVHILTE